jgi:large subunit ribosomal protein L32
MRRSHMALGKTNLIACPNCHELRLAHHVCPNCGHYKGAEVIEVKEKKAKKGRPA